MRLGVRKFGTGGSAVCAWPSEFQFQAARRYAVQRLSVFSMVTCHSDLARIGFKDTISRSRLGDQARSVAMTTRPMISGHTSSGSQ